MNDSENLIRKFYAALQHLDYQTMQQCYHSEAVFEDPVFGKLSGDRAQAMWKMLCLNAKELSLSVDNVAADHEKGSCDVTARYLFSQTGRKVENRIHAEFRFLEGKIVDHHDRFNLWRWSRQALGLSGWLLGWAPFFQRGIRQKAKSRLERFIEKEKPRQSSG